ncbi:MAG: DUF5665 domain-containing protein [Eubacteriales bacterium]
MKITKKAFCSLNQKVNELLLMLEKMKLVEYLSHLNRPRRIIWVNFLGGLARGFGSAIGFILLGALFIYILQQIVLSNIPAIGEFVAKIMNIANQHR